MNWLKKKLMQYFLGQKLIALKGWLKGKKTVTGAVSFLLWIAIYAMPAFGPDYNSITVAGTAIRDFLLSNGIDLDNSLFNLGTGFTVIGLVGKILDMFSKGKNE